MSIEDEIYTIIYNEMNSLLNKMVDDFSDNYDKKEYNWLIAEFSPTTLSYLVLVSSLESKYGNMFEKIARQICELTYGKDNVPPTIKGIGITDDEYNDYIKDFDKKKQYIISKFHKRDNSSTLSQFRAEHEGHGSGNNKVPSTLNQSELSNLLNNDFKKSDKIQEQEVDLIFYDKYEGRWKLFEIKAGGNLDSSNARANVIKMLRIYASFGDENANMYFATLYHKNGEGNTWDGGVKKHLGDDCILIGKAFWEQILRDITYEDLLKIYKKVFRDIGFEDALNKLINETAINSSNRDYQSKFD